MYFGASPYNDSAPHCIPPHPSLSPAAVFGPGDKLVSDSHVVNKGHVVIGTGAALIDWV